MSVGRWEWTLSSKAHTPEVEKPGALQSFDIWESGVAHVHGGQKYLIGFHDHFARLDRFYLLPSKSWHDVERALNAHIAWCASHNVTILRVHTDNALELSGPKAVALFHSKRIHLTTSSARVPQQNGVGVSSLTTYARCF